MILIVGFSEGQAQWRTHGIDSLSQGARGLFIRAIPGPGVALKDTTVRLSSESFRMESEIRWTTADPPEAVFLVWGRDSAVGIAGYHFGNQHLFMGRPTTQADPEALSPATMPLSRKHVQVVPRKKRVFIKWEYRAAKGVIRLEVNGVPLEINQPYPIDTIDKFGLGIQDGSATFQRIQIGWK